MTGAWEVPASWQWANIGEVAAIFGGGTPKTSDPANFDGGEIPWITPADLSGYREKFIARGARNITENGLKSSSTRMMPAGTVLFSSRAPIGYVAIASQPVTTNQGFKSFVLPDEIDPSYTYYYLQTARELVESLSGGTTFKEISGTNAARIPLVIAPLPEQRRIVAEIEKQFTRLDASVGALRRTQANLKRYRASVLRAACSGELVPTEAELARAGGREYEPASVLLERILAERRAYWEAQEKRRGKYKEPAAPDESDLPLLPEGWVWSNLDQMASIGTGSTPLTSNAEFYENGTVPWVTSAALMVPQVKAPTKYVTELAVQECNLSIYAPGTLLLAMYGEGRTRGNCSELMIEAAINQAISAIVMRKSARPARPYAKTFLLHNYDQTRRLSAGGVQPNLNLSLVKGLAIPLPPLVEQRRIVAEVERRLSVIQQAEAAVDASLQRAERLRQSILKQAFSGHLVAQDPDDEPASVLLERIRAQREAEQAASATKKRPARRRRATPKAQQLTLEEASE